VNWEGKTRDNAVEDVIPVVVIFSNNGKQQLTRKQTKDRFLKKWHSRGRRFDPIQLHFFILFSITTN